MTLHRVASALAAGGMCGPASGGRRQPGATAGGQRMRRSARAGHLQAGAGMQQLLLRLQLSSKSSRRSNCLLVNTGMMIRKPAGRTTRRKETCLGSEAMQALRSAWKRRVGSGPIGAPPLRRQRWAAKRPPPLPHGRNAAGPGGVCMRSWILSSAL